MKLIQWAKQTNTAPFSPRIPCGRESGSPLSLTLISPKGIWRGVWSESFIPVNMAINTVTKRFFNIRSAAYSSSLFNSTTTPPALSHTRPSSTSSPPNRTKTPLEKQFETWVHHLKPGFTPSDVDRALKAQSDPDLALDIFRWTAQQRSYAHNHLTYLTIIKQLIAGRRYRQAETLVEEVIAGACDATVPLYNSIIRFCCGRKFLFNRAFDAYNKMLRSEDCKPNLETYTLLFNSLLRRFNKLHVCYVYLHAVRSLTKQMKASGVIPDTFVLNMIIKAYSKCLEVDEAIRVFHEMGLYGCEPNAYSYSYIAKGLCEKGRVNQGLGFFREMRGKCLLPSTSTYVIIVCSLALERRFEDAIEVMFDMLGNSRSPDHLTYKTVLEGLCREGRADEAFDLLDECKKRDVTISDARIRHFAQRVGIGYVSVSDTFRYGKDTYQ